MEVKYAMMPHAHATPKYATDGAAGMDIFSSEEGVIYAGTHRIFKTGLRFQVPPGHELQIRSRSGMAAKNKVFVLNSPGTLDSDYRGELMIVLMNVGESNYKVERGDRIAQVILCPFLKAELKFVQQHELDETARGEGGFGSTGA